MNIKKEKVSKTQVNLKYLNFCTSLKSSKQHKIKWSKTLSAFLSLKDFKTVSLGMEREALGMKEEGFGRWEMDLGMGFNLV